MHAEAVARAGLDQCLQLVIAQRYALCQVSDGRVVAAFVAFLDQCFRSVGRETLHVVQPDANLSVFQSAVRSAAYDVGL